jgi:hypothetical protein
VPVKVQFSADSFRTKVLVTREPLKEKLLVQKAPEIKEKHAKSRNNLASIVIQKPRRVRPWMKDVHIGALCPQTCWTRRLRRHLFHRAALS